VARILLATFGSYGDLFPYLAIGVELRRRGHAVTIATLPVYAQKVAHEGLEFHAVRPDIRPGDRELLAQVMDARRGTERVLRFTSSTVRESYDDTLPAAREADLIVSHPITFAAVIAAEKLRKPWVSSVLAPISFLSAYDPPVPAQRASLLKVRALGPGAMRVLWSIAKWQTGTWMREIPALRKELGLPPGEHALFEGSHSPRLVLALFSRWLTERQPDWPAQTVMTGFPFYDGGEAAPPELDRFLDAGSPPVVFTLGSSAVGVAGDFYRESLEAVRRLGARAVLMTGEHPQGLPDSLPPGVLAVPYAPHAAVMPRGAATVHQGGIGTTAQAMRAGKPMLVMPFAHDQFDNAERVRRLGVAEVLTRRRYTAARVEGLLGRLLNDARYGRAARELGERVRAEQGAAAAANAIQRILDEESNK